MSRVTRFGSASRSEQEPGGRPQLLVRPVGGEHLAIELIQRLIGGDRLIEVLQPRLEQRRLVGPPLHQHHVQRQRHVPGERGAGQQLVDQLRPLVGGRIGEKRPRLLGGRNDAGQIEIDPADKIGIAARRRKRPNRRGLNQRVDPLVQRLLTDSWPLTPTPGTQRSSQRKPAQTPGRSDHRRNSWGLSVGASFRVTLPPTSQWAGQFLRGRLTSHPSTDQHASMRIVVPTAPVNPFRRFRFVDPDPLHLYTHTLTSADPVSPLGCPYENVAQARAVSPQVSGHYDRRDGERDDSAVGPAEGGAERASRTSRRSAWAARAGATSRKRRRTARPTSSRSAMSKRAAAAGKRPPPASPAQPRNGPMPSATPIGARCSTRRASG